MDLFQLWPSQSSPSPDSVFARGRGARGTKSLEEVGEEGKGGASLSVQEEKFEFTARTGDYEEELKQTALMEGVRTKIFKREGSNVFGENEQFYPLSNSTSAPLAIDKNVNAPVDPSLRRFANNDHNLKIDRSSIQWTSSCCDDDLTCVPSSSIDVSDDGSDDKQTWQSSTNRRAESLNDKDFRHLHYSHSGRSSKKPPSSPAALSSLFVSPPSPSLVISAASPKSACSSLSSSVILPSSTMSSSFAFSSIEDQRTAAYEGSQLVGRETIEHGGKDETEREKEHHFVKRMKEFKRDKTAEMKTETEDTQKNCKKTDERDVETDYRQTEGEEYKVVVTVPISGIADEGKQVNIVQPVREKKETRKEKEETEKNEEQESHREVERRVREEHFENDLLQQKSLTLSPIAKNENENFLPLWQHQNMESPRGKRQQTRNFHIHPTLALLPPPQEKLPRSTKNTSPFLSPFSYFPFSAISTSSHSGKLQQDEEYQRCASEKLMLIQEVKEVKENQKKKKSAPISSIHLSESNGQESNSPPKIWASHVCTDAGGSSDTGSRDGKISALGFVAQLEEKEKEQEKTLIIQENKEERDHRKNNHVDLLSLASPSFSLSSNSSSSVSSFRIAPIPFSTSTFSSSPFIVPFSMSSSLHLPSLDALPGYPLCISDQATHKSLVLANSRTDTPWSRTSFLAASDRLSATTKLPTDTSTLSKSPLPIAAVMATNSTSTTLPEEKGHIATSLPPSDIGTPHERKLDEHENNKNSTKTEKEKWVQVVRHPVPDMSSFSSITIPPSSPSSPVFYYSSSSHAPCLPPFSSVCTPSLSSPSPPFSLSSCFSSASASLSSSREAVFPLVQQQTSNSPLICSAFSTPRIILPPVALLPQKTSPFPPSPNAYSTKSSTPTVSGPAAQTTPLLLTPQNNYNHFNDTLASATASMTSHLLPSSPLQFSPFSSHKVSPSPQFASRHPILIPHSRSSCETAFPSWSTKIKSCQTSPISLLGHPSRTRFPASQLPLARLYKFRKNEPFGGVGMLRRTTGMLKSNMADITTDLFNKFNRTVSHVFSEFASLSSTHENRLSRLKFADTSHIYRYRLCQTTSRKAIEKAAHFETQTIATTSPDRCPISSSKIRKATEREETTESKRSKDKELCHQPKNSEEKKKGKEWAKAKMSVYQPKPQKCSKQRICHSCGKKRRQVTVCHKCHNFSSYDTHKKNPWPHDCPRKEKNIHSSTAEDVGHGRRPRENRKDRIGKDIDMSDRRGSKKNEKTNTNLNSLSKVPRLNLDNISSTGVANSKSAADPAFLSHRKSSFPSSSPSLNFKREFDASCSSHSPFPSSLSSSAPSSLQQKSSSSMACPSKDDDEDRSTACDSSDFKRSATTYNSSFPPLHLPSNDFSSWSPPTPFVYIDEKGNQLPTRSIYCLGPPGNNKKWRWRLEYCDEEV